MPLFENDKKNFVIFAALIIIQMVLISIQVPVGRERSYFKSAVFAVFSPLQRVAAGFARGVSDAWHDYFDLRGIRAENQKMKKEVFFLRQENKLLKDAVGFSKDAGKFEESLARLDRSFVVARVIGVDAGNYFKSVIINKGTRDGVMNNQAVCDRRGNLVGRTIEPVGLKEACVQLVTDNDCGVSVISDTDKIVGILSGDGQGRCRLNYVVTTTPGGAVGESLTTTGFDRIYPAGLRVGRILDISEESSLFKRILVEPSFTFSELDRVAVILANLQDSF